MYRRFALRSPGIKHASQNEVAVSVATFCIDSLSACFNALDTGGTIHRAGPPTPRSASVEGTGGRETDVPGLTCFNNESAKYPIGSQRVPKSSVTESSSVTRSSKISGPTCKFSIALRSASILYCSTASAIVSGTWYIPKCSTNGTVASYRIIVWPTLHVKGSGHGLRVQTRLRETGAANYQRQRHVQSRHLLSGTPTFFERDEVPRLVADRGDRR